MSSTNFSYRGTTAPSRSKIEITQHGAKRLSERLGLSTQRLMRDHLYSVRYLKGIDIARINIYNYKNFHITDDVLHYAKTYPYYNNNGYKVFLYGECLYFFTGKDSRKFITVVKIPDECTKGQKFSAERRNIRSRYLD